MAYLVSAMEFQKDFRGVLGKEELSLKSLTTYQNVPALIL